jgi:hypothetical protein
MILHSIYLKLIEPLLSAEPEKGATYGPDQFYRAVIIIFAMLILFAPGLEANEGGESTGGEVAAESRTAKEIINEFMQVSVELRLEYDFIGGFFDEGDREKLLKLCRKTRRELGARFKRYRQRRDEIEAYEGDDWDELYGATGLWRKTAKEAQRCIWYKNQVEYFLAVASKQDEREKILVDIILRCQAGEGFFSTAAGELLQAEASCAMGSKVYLQRAQKIIETLLAKEDLTEDVYFKGKIVQLKLDESISGMRVLEVVEDLRQSQSKDDFELNMRLAFLGMRAGWSQLLEEVVGRWPSAEGFVGRLLLKKMVAEEGEEEAGEKKVFEVEIAVKAALQQEVSEHKQMILELCEKEKYRTALVLYGAASACAESEPTKAVEFYMQSARARKKEKNSRLEIEAAKIMQEGAELACKLYYKDAKHICLCEETLKEYFKAAGESSDEGLRYFYVGVLEGRRKREEVKKLLGEIAGGGGEYSLNARLDLIMRELGEGKVNEAQKEKIEKQLKELIESAEVAEKQGESVKGEAVKIYCRLLLDDGGEESGREVLSMLEGVPLDKGTEEVFLKARALGILGRWPEAVSIAANGIESDDCDMAIEAFSVLSGAVERLEENSERASERGVFVNGCMAIADYCIGCLDGSAGSEVEIMKAEVMLLSRPGEKTHKQIEAILTGQKGLDSIEVMRCRAKLSAAKGDFAEAGKIWGQVCTARAGVEKSQDRDWRWWRAKFNQLYCLSRRQGIDKEEIIRSIEVLEKSFNDIPVFWAKKLKELKKGLLK